MCWVHCLRAASNYMTRPININPDMLERIPDSPMELGRLAPLLVCERALHYMISSVQYRRRNSTV